MTTFSFRAGPGLPLEGEPLYTRSEYSFRFEPTDRELFDERIAEAGVMSVSIGRLQIEVAIGGGLAFYVWGLHPALNWSTGRATPRDPSPGVVAICEEDAFMSGVSVKLAAAGEWSTTYDEISGWVCVTPDLTREDEQVVLIATGTCLGLVGDQLNSVWVRPTFED